MSARVDRLRVLQRLALARAPDARDATAVALQKKMMHHFVCGWWRWLRSDAYEADLHMKFALTYLEERLWVEVSDFAPLRAERSS